MATNSFLRHDTLAGWGKSLDPQGRVAKITELLTQQNEILEDMLWIEANNINGHMTSIRTGLPEVYWAALGEYVLESNSQEAQVTEGIGRMKTWHQVDAEQVEMSSSPNDYRMMKGYAHMEAMNQEFASTLFYGNATLSPKEFNGLAMRYSSTTAGNGKNVILGGGVDSADNTSIWLVVWHGATVAGLFPRGSKAGIVHKNFGKVTSETSEGLLEVYRDKWQMAPGLALMDHRQVCRIANIDVSELRADTGSHLANLRKLMTRMVHRVNSLKMGKPVIYMNRTVLEALDVQGYNDSRTAGPITKESVDGVPKRDFMGIPVKICDAILNTESLAA